MVVRKVMNMRTRLYKQRYLLAMLLFFFVSVFPLRGRRWRRNGTHTGRFQQAAKNGILL